MNALSTLNEHWAYKITALKELHTPWKGLDKHKF